MKKSKMQSCSEISSHWRIQNQDPNQDPNQQTFSLISQTDLSPFRLLLLHFLIQVKLEKSSVSLGQIQVDPGGSRWTRTERGPAESGSVQISGLGLVPRISTCLSRLNFSPFLFLQSLNSLQVWTGEAPPSSWPRELWVMWSRKSADRWAGSQLDSDVIKRHANVDDDMDRFAPAYLRNHVNRG